MLTICAETSRVLWDQSEKPLRLKGDLCIVNLHSKSTQSGCQNVSTLRGAVEAIASDFHTQRVRPQSMRVLDFIN